MDDEDLTGSRTPPAPRAASCAGLFTANSMNCLTEAIGMGLPGNGTIPAVYSERIRLAKHAGMRVMELLARRTSRPRDHDTDAAIRNAMTLDMAFGGSTNTVLHLTAIAHEAGADITLDDWARSAAHAEPLRSRRRASTTCRTCTRPAASPRSCASSTTPASSTATLHDRDGRDRGRSGRGRARERTTR